MKLQVLFLVMDVLLVLEIPYVFLSAKIRRLFNKSHPRR